MLGCLYVFMLYICNNKKQNTMKNLAFKLQSITLNSNQKTALFIFALVTFILFCIYNTPPRYR